MCFRRKLLLGIMVVGLSGCMTTHVMNPGYTDIYSGLQGMPRKTILFVAPNVECYKIAAGGIKEQIDEWEQATQKNFIESFSEQLRSNYNVSIKYLDELKLSQTERKELKQQSALYGAVVKSIDRHLYSPESTLSTKKKNFDYSLGPYFEYLKNAYNADVMLLVSGVNLRATLGKVFMDFFQSIAIGAATGVAVAPQSEGSIIFVSLVDCDTGDVVWFDKKLYLQYKDLTNPKCTKKIARDFASNIPFAKVGE